MLLGFFSQNPEEVIQSGWFHVEHRFLVFLLKLKKKLSEVGEALDKIGIKRVVKSIRENRESR